MRILTIANQKGGVGKTTTAINLATALAAVGETVLLVDLDPQGNASTGLGIDRRIDIPSVSDVLMGEAAMQDAMAPTAVPNLFVARSTLDLLGIEVELAKFGNRATRLKTALHDAVDAHGNCPWTYVLVDCPPSLNLLTINALACANAVLVPLQCEFFALEGLSQLLSTVEQVRGSINPEIQIHGIVLTMYDSRNSLSAQVMEDVRKTMGTMVYDTVIPRNVRVSEAPSYGKPAILYDFKCAGSQAYVRLASEILQRERTFKTAA